MNCLNNHLTDKVQALLADLRSKIQSGVPDYGDFPMVYSEFKVTDRSMCLTDVLLKFQPIPKQLPNHDTQRWLELVGYKLPAPIKATQIIFKGTTQEVLHFLTLPEAVLEILRVIPRLDFNLEDV